MKKIEDHVAIDAYNVVGSLAAKKAMDEFREATYRMWVNCGTVEDREQLYGIAAGAESFWRIMEAYGTSGKKIVEGLDEHLQKNLEAVT